MDNIKVNLKEIYFEDQISIELAQDCAEQRDVHISEIDYTKLVLYQNVVEEIL